MDRAQAYTLEALIAAILLLTAVLFAVQSVVITPTSSGTLDQDVQAQMHQEASDVLVTAANEGELSDQLRYWNASSPTYADGEGGNGYVPGQGYANDTLPVEDLGPTLSATFDEGIRYNVELVYRNNGTRNTTRLVFQGTPGDEVVVATHTVTLTDNMTVTGPGGDGRTLEEYAEDARAAGGEPPIPNEYDGPIYNVVEVRIVLW